MWSFWKSRNRFSLDELKYLTDQLQKVQVVNEVNKDFVIEALRSIAELVTYGDQHDAAFFDFFMEKQVLGEFVRILKISRTIMVSLQLLQTMSIMIQNIKHEHAIYYLFSNEHINYLITYSFDFRNEELLSYYISFLRAISGHLNKGTISLLVKTQDDDVVCFPLYDEAIRFASHEESMIRIAVRALTLNVYHVGDESVNKYVTSGPLGEYFVGLVSFFKKQCVMLNDLVFGASKEHSQETSSSIIASMDEIEDNLYYFSDVISAGIPDVDSLITDNLLRLLILPLLLPSLTIEADMPIGAVTSLYLLCCILRIVKIKDLANTVCASLFCTRDVFLSIHGTKSNGDLTFHKVQHTSSKEQNGATLEGGRNLEVFIPDNTSLQDSSNDVQLSLREVVLSYLNIGSDIQALGSLSLMATLLQTKELEESMLDALGILPQRKQHKKLLLQALVGESSGEEQLFSSGSNSLRGGFTSELDFYLQKLKEYGVSYSAVDKKSSPRSCRFQVLDALVNLLCRSDISAETLWDCGWLLRQLLPYSEAEFNRQHLKLLRESFDKYSSHLLLETRGAWADFLISVICDEWRKCKKAMESSSPRKELRCMVSPSYSEGVVSSESSTVGERMCEVVKAFVLLCQLQIFSQGRTLPDNAPTYLPGDIPKDSRAIAIGVDIAGPKQGIELKLEDAIPCRIAFERGKERYVWFQAVSMGTGGWVMLLEELPLRQNVGVVRVVAPLAACNPRVDDKHPRWLHLRIRPPTLQAVVPLKYGQSVQVKGRTLVDGRWTLAFRDEESCKSAVSRIYNEFNLQSQEVERRLTPLVHPENCTDPSTLSFTPLETITLPPNTL
ncbi:protein TRANSPARENT TESTA 9 isoform X2 [Silene latifolia]|uniref:protein TRANSPARENT TESTA 9 isoform X2 n=1 Tax=Silene latifolia TaxID=37657 RepID=UPI003D77AD75